MSNPTRDQIADLLLTQFPSLRAGYAELISWRPEPGNHLVFRILFTPRLVALLESGASPQPELTAMFTFVEDLARNQSDGVRELVVESVLAPLVDEPRWVRSARPLMGETTRRFVRAIARAST